MSTSGAERSAVGRAGGGRAGAAGGSAGEQNEQGNGDWRKTLLRSVMMYFAMQLLVGPNGLVNWYRGKTELQSSSTKERSADESSADIGGELAQQGHSAIQKPFGEAAQPLPEVRLAPGTMSTVLFPPEMPLDVYVFVTASEAPSHADLATQQSRLVPGGKGAHDVGRIDPTDSTLAELFAIQTTSQASSRIEPVIWTSPSSEANVLGALKWSSVRLDDAKLQREADLTIRVPESVQGKNGSLWADILVSSAGHLPQGKNSLRVRKLLTRLYPERKERVEKKLFDKPTEEQEAKQKSATGASALPFLDKEPARLIGWWHNNLTLAVVTQDAKTGLPVSKLPPPLLQHVHIQEDDEGKAFVPADKAALNFPVVFPNDFWHLREHMHPINSTHETLPLHVSLYMTSFFKFQLLAAMSDSFEKSQGMAANEMDMVKLTLMENSPWYLGLTIGVSILHSLFEFLAFSSDVSHWRKKDNMAGVSLGSILTNVIVQLIILLYLLDQAQETSWMILASQAVGIVIEAWKLTKAVTVGIVPRKKGEGSKYLRWMPYRVDIRDKHVLTEEERRTQEFDKLAFRIVSYVAIPLLGAYTVYSALYQTHKGWWSFIIGTLCSFVYAFGFVSLIPQLIVNYKLKSTAGMNSKTFVYKILGTFVDDLFAFAIRQPWLHRMACFRDDVVFMVFLYQRWIYGVDPTRVNEFGQVLEERKEDKALSSEKITSATAKEGEAGKLLESKKDI